MIFIGDPGFENTARAVAGGAHDPISPAQFPEFRPFFERRAGQVRNGKTFPPLTKFKRFSLAASVSVGVLARLHGEENKIIAAQAGGRLQHARVFAHFHVKFSGTDQNVASGD